MNDLWARLALGVLILVHAGVILAVVVGALAAARGALMGRPKLEAFYLITVVLVALSFLFTGGCFLTTWEKALRVTYWPATAYTGGFIAHYLGVLGFDVTDKQVFWTLVVVIALGLVATALHHRKVGRAGG